MTLTLTLHLTALACIVLALALTILRIGQALGNCPATGRAARAAGLTIATGYLTIGGGAGLLITGGALMLFPVFYPAAMLATLGFAILCLGLGFGHAVTTLRDVVAAAAMPADPAEAPA